MVQSRRSSLIAANSRVDDSILPEGEIAGIVEIRPPDWNDRRLRTFLPVRLLETSAFALAH
jgi:hypothetical protein